MNCHPAKNIYTFHIPQNKIQAGRIDVNLTIVQKESIAWGNSYILFIVLQIIESIYFKIFKKFIFSKHVWIESYRFCALPKKWIKLFCKNEGHMTLV